MTTTASHLPPTLTANRDAISFRIRWSINPRALIAAPAAANLLNGHAPTLSRAALEWRISRNPDSARAMCILTLDLSTGEHDEIPLADWHHAHITTADALEHIDVPGALKFTRRADSCILCFARTTILRDTLGLPGGVYEAPTIVAPAP